MGRSPIPLLLSTHIPRGPLFKPLGRMSRSPVSHRPASHCKVAKLLKRRETKPASSVRGWDPGRADPSPQRIAQTLFYSFKMRSTRPADADGAVSVRQAWSPRRTRCARRRESRPALRSPPPPKQRVGSVHCLDVFDPAK